MNRKELLSAQKSRSLGTIQSGKSKKSRVSKVNASQETVKNWFGISRRDPTKTVTSVKDEKPGLFGKILKVLNLTTAPDTEGSTNDEDEVGLKVKPFLNGVVADRHNPSPPIQPAERLEETREQMCEWKSTYTQEFYHKQADVVSSHRKVKLHDYD